MALRKPVLPTTTMRGVKKATWSEPAQNPRFPRPKGGNPPKASVGVTTAGLYARLKKLY